MPPPVALDDVTYGYNGNGQLVAKNGTTITLPEYYRLTKDAKNREQWVVVRILAASDNVASGGDLDPAVILTPPKWLEIGYVPIVTRQAAKE